MYKIEYHEAGRWWKLAEAPLYEDALWIAGSYCEKHPEDSIRIITPEGQIL